MSASETDTMPDKTVPSKLMARRRWRRFLPKLQLRDLFWLSLLSAVLMTWYRDHQSLSDQLAIQSGLPGTSWSIKQLLGGPDTPSPGDRATAWASATPDGSAEWIIVEFASVCDLSAVEVYETYNPGAITRLCRVSPSGTEQELWKGSDPTPRTAAMGRSVLPVPRGTKTRRVKIYLDSPAVSGWNEIDAVALRDRSGAIQWATDAWASSAYGENQDLPRWFWP